MKETKTTDENFFKEIMSKSRLDLPFSDFEDNVMMQIETKVLHQNKWSKELRLSWIFFIVGSVFGIILSIFIAQLHEPIFGIQPVNLTLFFAIVFASVLFTQIDTLIKFSRRINSKEEFRGSNSIWEKVRIHKFQYPFCVKMDDTSQTKLVTGRGYCEQVKGLMEI